MIRFDPPADRVFYNGHALGRMSEIKDFFAEHNRYGRIDWGEWGVELTDGRFFVFSSEPFDRYDNIDTYMNSYLKKYPPNQNTYSK